MTKTKYAIVTFAAILPLISLVQFLQVHKDILASSQNHTGNDSIITTTGEATKIHSGHSNPITKTNGLLNNLSGNGKVVILTFGDTEDVALN